MLERSLLSERAVLVGGELLVVDCEPVEQSAQFQLLEDHSDAAHDAGLVGDHVVASRQHHVAARGRHVARESVQLQVVPAREVLQLLPDYLALHGQASRRVDHHCERCGLRSAYFCEALDHLLGAELGALTVGGE